MEAIETFATRALGMTREEFCQKNLHPFLVIRQQPQDESAVRNFSTQAIKTAEVKTIRKGTTSAVAERHVVPIAKANRGHSFAFVSLGRTRNNDIVLDSPFISKCHVLFKPEAGSRAICYDTGSTNGTALNGVRLQPNMPTPLKDADELDFSGSFTATYFTPGGLYDYMKTGSSTRR